MVKYISYLGKILLCVMILCNNSILLGMELTNFPYTALSLVTDNAHLLTKWIHKEAQGTFSPELRRARKELSKMFFDPEFILVCTGIPQDSINRAFYVVEAKKNKRELWQACLRSDLDKIIKIVSKSPYSIQAYNYGSFFNSFERCPILYKVVESHCSLSVIEALLKMGACVRGKTSKWGNSALHDPENKYVARLLIAYGADINQKNFKGKNPLWRSVFRQSRMVDYFLKHGADVDCVDMNGISLMEHVLGATGLKKYAKRQRVSFFVIKKLLSHIHEREQWINSRQGIIKSCIASGNTYWFKFANILYIPFDPTYVDCTMIDYIKNRGAQLKAMSINRQIPLSVYNERVYSIAKLFLMLKNVKKQTEHDGICINSRGCLFQNASYDDLAQIVGRDSIVSVRKHILRYCGKMSYDVKIPTTKYAYFFALAYDKKIAFQSFKRIMMTNKEWFNQQHKHYCLDCTDELGNTLLHLSVEPSCHSKGVMSWLINNGIDFTAKNNVGLTAFDVADTMEDKTILLRLMKSIHHFFSERCRYQYLKKYKVFLDAFFVRVSCDPQMSFTWLQLIFSSRSITQSFKYGWIKQLLSEQMSINQVNNLNHSLLHYAISAEHKEVIDLLLAHGALVKEYMKINGPSTLKDMLVKAYDNQKCCMCCEHIHEITSIPCPHYHSKQYICQKCYKNLPVKKCPLCRSNLLPHRWESL